MPRADSPPPPPPASDFRFLDLFVDSPSDADAVVCGIPYDGAVIGRKGAREGPGAIRDAFRWFGTDALDGPPLRRRIHDAGDVGGLDGTVLEAHDQVAQALEPIFAHGHPVVVLGGDNSLSYPVVQALCKARAIGPGNLGLIVVDAHYDLRGYEGQPTSGTPFRRILTELAGAPVRGSNLVELGIRPYANSAGLAAFAAEQRVHVVSRDAFRSTSPATLAEDALHRAGDGVEHLWLSIDIDALDQSIAAGCSAPSPDGLLLHELAPIIEAVARDPRCRGMEIMETAPALDPTGNTARSAAWLVARFLAALS